MIAIHRIGHRDVRPVATVDLHDHHIEVCSVDNPLLDVLAIALAKPARRWEGNRLVEPSDRSQQLEARLKAHVGRPYFCSPEPIELTNPKRAMYPATLLDHSEAVLLA